MIDKPGVDERLLAAEVAAAWAVDIASLVFMPVGLDGQAWAYRVDTSDGERYFLKMRRGEFTRAAVLLPGFLRAGLVVARRRGAFWPSGRRRLAYPARLRALLDR
ncbi:hypothetical protein M2302_004594 [Micromonospora sp. A200]|uniref:hypothetical protein n=1 Tax=Micromonospora sp. A200 TaxID=2940568 RepID=UPI002473A9DA|nr:hypothetical protein [Micromonospora sp. A200]MDH6464395.1 hypothetical protein [Micromonospora sp. A200]